MEFGIRSMAALYQMKLKRGFDNRTLSALNLGVNAGTNRVDKANLAYLKAFECGFIREDGTARHPADFEALQVACQAEVNRRVAAGSWV